MNENNPNTTESIEEPEVFGGRAVNPSATSDSSKRVEVRVNSDAAKRRLGRDIYTTRQRAFEEMTGNSFTGMETAVEDGYLDPEEALLHIQAFPSKGDQYCLRVIDNGIGMTEKVVRDVFCEFGITTHGSDSGKMGQFGMGVASYPNLVGFDDGMLYIETHSRRNEDAIAGRFTIDDFVYETGTDELQLLGDTEYGTAVEAWLVESISLQDITEWVEELAEENPLPILFQYEYRNGRQEKEEYDVVPISERLSNTTPHLYFENEVVEVACGLGVPSKTVLLHKEIDWDNRFSGQTTPFRKNVYVRFKTESVQEVEGDQKMVVSESQYDAKSERVKSKYKKSSEVAEDMALTPRVVGNREKLVDNNGCSEWIVEKLRETLSQRLQSIVESIDTVSDYLSLRTSDKKLFDMAIRGRVAGVRKYKYKNYERGDVSIGTNQSRVQSYFGSNYGVEVSNETAHLFAAMFSDDFVKEGTLGYEVERARQAYRTDVYIGCSIDSKKKSVVMDHDEHTIVKQVGSASAYEKYQEAFGWKLLKNITKDRLSEFDISDETRRKWNNTAQTASETKTGVEVPNESLTIHYGRKQNKKKKASAKYVYNKYYDGDSLYHNQDLVLFTPDSSYNLSDFYEYIEGNQYGMANASTKVADVLSSLDSVFTIDTLIEQSQSYSVPTTTGYQSLGAVLQADECLPIILSNSEYETLRAITQDEIDMVERLYTVIDRTDSILAQFEGEFNSIGVLKAEAIVEQKFAIAGGMFKLVSTRAARSDGVNNLPVNIGYSYKRRLDLDSRELAYSVGLCEYADTEAYDMLQSTAQDANGYVRIIKYLQTQFEAGQTTIPE